MSTSDGGRASSSAIQTIEFDTRLSKTFSRLTPHSVIRDRILEFALEEDERELPSEFHVFFDGA